VRKLLQLAALLSVSVAIAGCSTDPRDRSFVTGTRFEHRTQPRSDGKTTLIVTPVAGVVRDEMIISQEAQSYAEAFAHRTCPKGYNFYGAAALYMRRGERTFVFQCE
jgi:hypothetical protein